MKMKNKKAEQIEKKKRHRESLKAAKARRRGKPDLTRPEPSKREKPTILIVCEGENTEPSYFPQFRLTSATIKAVGEGYNTVSLIDRAVELAQAGDYEQVWCVFDKDEFPDADFNNAITMAENQDLQVAYSNQAFEYWLLLHFEDHQGGAMDRSRYAGKLNHYLAPLGANFDDDKKMITEDIFSILQEGDNRTGQSRTDLAIRRAKRIYDLWDHQSPAKEESSTTVFQLVEEILKFV